MAIRTATALTVLLLAAAGCADDDPAPAPAVERAPASSTSSPMTRSGVTATGTVSFFNTAKGYGYITPDDGGEQVFVHFSEIRMEGFKKLQEGQRVQYVPAKGPRGTQATDVYPLEE